MRHPTITEWTDYVRAIAGERRRAALRSHLDQGCDPCQEMVSTLERVNTTAEIDGAIAPPEGAIRSVKAFFHLQHPEGHGGWRELALRRSFDSVLAPMAASSRSANPTTRQMLFESDQYTLELSLDFMPDEVDSVLRGQLLEAEGGPRSHTPIFLVGDGEVIGRTISELHGTFEMSGPLDQSCELWVFPDDDNRIRLSLKPEH